MLVLDEMERRRWHYYLELWLYLTGASYSISFGAGVRSCFAFNQNPFRLTPSFTIFPLALLYIFSTRMRAVTQSDTS